MVDHIFLISPQLVTQALLGVDFCRVNSIIMNFPEHCLIMERDGIVSRHHFKYDNNIRSKGISDLGPTDNCTETGIECLQISTNSITNRTTADYPKYKLSSRAASEVEVAPRSESKDNN
jgi:hypothetical protein